MTTLPSQRILMASTGLNQAIAQKALALYEHGLLDSFISTLVFPAGRGSFGKMQALASRQISGLPPAVIQRWPWFDLLRLASSRLDPTGVITDRLWELSDKAFSRHVGRNLRGVQVVLGFEHASLEMFEAAVQLGIKRVYEVPSAHSGLIRDLLQPERERFPELITPYVRQTSLIESRRQARRDAEFRMADVVLAHSRFARDSYVKAGFDGARILRVPFGSPPINQAVYQQLLNKRPARSALAPVFLFAGNVALHKGVLTLWDAWRKAALRGARLLVAGQVHLPESVMRRSPPGIDYLGKLPWAELQALYQDCTALVFPTLSDGFGMVVTEALAQGLPVITTPNAGAADLITHGENGLITPIQDAQALANAMTLLADDPELAGTMRLRAIESARKWQWPDFRAAFAATLQEALRET